MAEYGFACHVWFSAGKYDQKTQSAEFSLQSVVKYSKVRRMRYTQHTNQTQCYLFVLIKQLIFYIKKLHAALNWNAVTQFVGQTVNLAFNNQVHYWNNFL